MPAIQELQADVAQLSADELARFRAWFEEFDAKVWDKQFEEDVKLGKLDHLGIKRLLIFEQEIVKKYKTFLEYLWHITILALRIITRPSGPTIPF